MVLSSCLDSHLLLHSLFLGRVYGGMFLPSVCTLISQNYILLGILSNPESVTADSQRSAKLACLIRFLSLGYPSLFADEKWTAGRDIHPAFGNHPYFTPHTCTDTPLN